MYIENIDDRINKKLNNNGMYDYMEDDLIKAFLTLIVRNKKGKVIKRYIQRSHSPTSNFITLIGGINYLRYNIDTSAIINNGGKYNPIDPAYWASSSSLSVLYSLFGIAYPSNGLDLGYPDFSNYDTLIQIQVGSGMQSDPYSAYALASPIKNGSGTGQLIYGNKVAPSSITIDGEIAFITFTQPLTNLSGSAITITEIGLIVQRPIYVLNGYAVSGNYVAVGGAPPPPSVNYYLMWYDVLSNPITISNGSSTNVYLTIAIND